MLFKGKVETYNSPFDTVMLLYNYHVVIFDIVQVISSEISHFRTPQQARKIFLFVLTDIQGRNATYGHLNGIKR